MKLKLLQFQRCYMSRLPKMTHEHFLLSHPKISRNDRWTEKLSMFYTLRTPIMTLELLHFLCCFPQDRQKWHMKCYIFYCYALRSTETILAMLIFYVVIPKNHRKWHMKYYIFYAVIPKDLQKWHMTGNIALGSPEMTQFMKCYFLYVVHVIP